MRKFSTIVFLVLSGFLLGVSTAQAAHNPPSDDNQDPIKCIVTGTC